jgi:hypothetical protein
MSEYTILILATLVGFFALAYALLAPVYNFLDREEQASKEWTPERVAEKLRERDASTNGTTKSPPERDNESEKPTDAR